MLHFLDLSDAAEGCPRHLRATLVTQQAGEGAPSEVHPDPGGPCHMLTRTVIILYRRHERHHW